MSNALLNCCDICREEKPLTRCKTKWAGWEIDVCKQCKIGMMKVRKKWKRSPVQRVKESKKKYNRKKEKMKWQSAK